MKSSIAIARSLLVDRGSMRACEPAVGTGRKLGPGGTFVSPWAGEERSGAAALSAGAGEAVEGGHGPCCLSGAAIVAPGGEDRPDTRIMAFIEELPGGDAQGCSSVPQAVLQG